MSTEVNDRFYGGKTVLTEDQEQTIENLLGYYDRHGALPHWTKDAVALLRDLLPDSSAYKVCEHKWSLRYFWHVCDHCGEVS